MSKDKLNIGEIRLPSGAIVIPKYTPASVDAYKQQLKNRLEKKLQKNKAAAKISQNFYQGIWTLRLRVLEMQLNTKLQSICDEYVGYVLQPKMRLLSSRIKKFIIEIETLQGRISDKCEYDIEQRLKISPFDGAMLPRKSYDYQSLNVDGLENVLIAELSQTKRIDINKTISDFLIIVPFNLSQTVKMGQFLHSAAKELYSRNEFANHIIRFIAVKSGSVSGRFIIPGRSVMAFPLSHDKIILINEIQYKRVRLTNSKKGTIVKNDFIAVHFFNTNLASSIKTEGSEFNRNSYNAYIQKKIYDDARDALEAAGLYAARKFDASKIVITSNVAIPGRRFGLRIPINFEFKNNKWMITNSKK